MKTIEYIEELRYNRIKVSKEQQKAVLEYFGEKLSIENTEQDIWEQTRKIIQDN